MEILVSLIIFLLTVIIGSALIVGLLLGGFFGYIFYMRWRDREERSLDYVLLQVKVPRDNEVKIDAMEQMLTSLAVLKGPGGKFSTDAPDHITLEIVGRYGDINFYICVPQKYQDLVEKQIHGSYNGADVRIVDEYNIFFEQGEVAWAQLGLSDTSYNPLRTYKELAVDSISSITSALAKMGEYEGAAIQIVLTGTDGKWSKEGRRYVSTTKKNEADPEKASYKVDTKTLEAIDNKVSKLGFEITIRVVVVAQNEAMAKSHLGNIKSTLQQFNSPHNKLKQEKVWIPHTFMTDFIYRYPRVIHWKTNRSIMSVDEIASIYHFPNKTVETPNINWLTAKSAPASPLIPTDGLYLGKSVFRGIERPVTIGVKDRQRHVYIIGKTGMGKTEMLKTMISQDIQAGKGVAVIDPHDLAEQIMEYIPPERAEDVIYFDPADTERPMGMNVMDAHTEDERHFVTGVVINMMYKLFDPHKTGIIGPRFEHAIRNSMLTVMEAVPGGTFMELVRCQTDPKYVQSLLPKVSDPVVRRYWTDQIAATSDFHKSEVLDYIVSKFGRFTTNKMMRNIICQSESAFDFRQVMDQKKILIVRLNKGSLGEENANFLGLLLVPRILMAAMSRADVPEDQRPDFHLYVDEFQNFATPDFATILSEARKYHLNLTVANQFLSQMDQEIRDAVIGNVVTKIVFWVGVDDAGALAREFEGVFTDHDLMNIDRFNAYVSTMVNNTPVPPFSMDTTKDMEADARMRSAEVAAMIAELSKLKYGRDREEVEMAITRRSGL